MYRTELKQVGSSIMLPVPIGLLEIWDIEVGAKVDMGIERGKLIIEPCKQKYTLQALLAEHKNQEKDEWVSSLAYGKELI